MTDAMLLDGWGEGFDEGFAAAHDGAWVYVVTRISPTWKQDEDARLDAFWERHDAMRDAKAAARGR